MLVLGHRGFPLPVHPENTLAAMVAGLDSGADGVEVDVRLTADGIAVCCHDDDLSRLGGRTRSVRASTWAQLSSDRLAGGHPVPRLADVVAATRGRGRLVLDLKPERRTALLVRAVSAALGTRRGDVVASSFDLRVLAAFALGRPDLPRALLCDVGCDPAQAVRASVADGSASLHLAIETVLADPESVRTARAAGLQVRVWTVNRLADAQLCALLGVQAVITDHPDRLVAGLATRTPVLTA